MASSYVNDLRLNEMATGDASGTWGDTTNTNLELIAEAFSYGTEASFSSDADVTTTIADGATDPVRSLYLKVTSSGSLSATRTLTIAPNTVSKVWIIENATSGSQSINISQGSGSNVTIPSGKTRVVYSDGAGSGAAVIDAFAALNLQTSGIIETSSSIQTPLIEYTDGDDAMTIADGGQVTFAQSIIGTLGTAAQPNITSLGTLTTLTVDDITIDGSTISDAGDFTIDAGGDIILDTDGADIRLKHAGTEWGRFVDNSNNLLILAPVADKDIMFNGIDGSSEITALTLDMSEGGNATFVGQIITSTPGSNNVRLGDGAGASIASGGTRNVAIGSNAGAAITTGDFNVAIGYNALNAEDTGSRSTAVGYFALDTQNNDDANHNTAVGFTALEQTTTGQYNTGIGSQALNANTTADNNTAVGYNALLVNTTGAGNTAIGDKSLDANTTAGDNTAVGYKALSANTTGTSNTAIGKDALEANTTANENTALGFKCLEANTTGTQNVAVGSTALNANTTGQNNVAVGMDCMAANTTGEQNVAVGQKALEANTTASNNTAIGLVALTLNTTGTQNTAVGKGALSANTTANNNTAVGYHALDLTTTGAQNTALGSQALNANTTANNNVAVGFNSLLSNTTGTQNVAVGTFALDACTTSGSNTALGYAAMSALTTSGGGNVAIGSNSLLSCTTGDSNIAIGFECLEDLTTSGNNVAMGHRAGMNVTTGANNTLIGHNNYDSLTTGSSNVSVGFSNDVDTGDAGSRFTFGTSLSATAGNTIKIGSGSTFITNTWGSNATWTHSSDERLKENIEDNSLGLDFINQLRTVTYNWKKQEDVPEELRCEHSERNTEDLQHGLVAQEVKLVLDKLGIDEFSGWSEEKDGMQMISESMFVFPLIKAVQELSTQVEELKAKLNQGE